VGLRGPTHLDLGLEVYNKKNNQLSLLRVTQNSNH